jgi:hypothetical protein
MMHNNHDQKVNKMLNYINMTKLLSGLLLLWVGYGLMNSAGSFDFGEFITGFTAFFTGFISVVWALTSQCQDIEEEYFVHECQECV